jgi:hypothetical protein
MYHDGLIMLKSQVDFDHLRNLHLLDKNEVGDTSWQYINMLKYNEDRRANNGHQCNCLVEWNNVNKTQSSINFSALSLSNPIPIISFARTNKVLDKMSFRHLVQYCQSKTEVEIAMVQKVLSSPTCIKFKFGIQIPNGIKHVIYLDKKNENSLWQDAIRTELKQLTDYQTFIALDSGEGIPKEYQKIPYHKVFDVKYDLRHKARLVAGGNWTVNDKEDI